jgi:hypothetical protein
VVAEIFDPFFAIVLVAVGILSFIDWLVGVKGRATVKEKVADFWTALQYDRLDDLFIRLLRRLVLRDTRGAEISLLVIAATANVALLASLVSVLIGRALVAYVVTVWAKPAGPFFVLLPPTVMVSCGVVPVRYLISVLRHDLKDGMGWGSIILILVKVPIRVLRFALDVFAVYAVISSLVWTYNDSLGHTLLMPLYPAIIQNDQQSLFFSFVFVLGFISTALCAYVILTILAMQPPFAFLALILLSLVVLKICRPFLQPLLGVVLARLYEESRGVLTQVAVGMGAVTKLVQELVKHASGGH